MFRVKRTFEEREPALGRIEKLGACDKLTGWRPEARWIFRDDLLGS
jgi:hypothetical protein